MLQSFIQSMLPKNAKNVFGKGIAGDIWKSMLAEKLANEVGRSGQVGLAKRLQAGSAVGRLAAVAPGAATHCSTGFAGERAALLAAAGPRRRSDDP